MIGAAKGVIRSMHCNSEYHAEVIPVDFAINGVLAIGWKTGTTKDRYYFVKSHTIINKIK